jgi:hypothetical protein
MLSEFVWYITPKEQPISMDNYLSFARLVIRGVPNHYIKEK